MERKELVVFTRRADGARLVVYANGSISGERDEEYAVHSRYRFLADMEIIQERKRFSAFLSSIDVSMSKFNAWVAENSHGTAPNLDSSNGDT